MSPQRRAAARGKLPATAFGHAYYQRFYHNPRTAVTSRGEMRARARLIAAGCEQLGLPVRRILEAGCGTGLLRTQLRRLLPRAQYLALEASEYLCRRYGWQHGRIEDYRTRAPFDLVVCYDVLQYLERAAAARALANFSRLCRGVLYFSALTRHDFAHNCDVTRTDPDVHLRSARWYRTRLAPRFREAGLGLWVRRGAPLTLWELEAH
ncbi:MAG: class I SAM-dependent methyltransferase [Steroidobacteraceae bacterium]